LARAGRRLLIAFCLTVISLINYASAEDVDQRFLVLFDMIELVSDNTTTADQIIANAIAHGYVLENKDPVDDSLYMAEYLCEGRDPIIIISSNGEWKSISAFFQSDIICYPDGTEAYDLVFPLQLIEKINDYGFSEQTDFDNGSESVKTKAYRLWQKEDCLVYIINSEKNDFSLSGSFYVIISKEKAPEV
jgi:hypothetical protein